MGRVTVLQLLSQFDSIGSGLYEVASPAVEVLSVQASGDSSQFGGIWRVFDNPLYIYILIYIMHTNQFCNVCV